MILELSLKCPSDFAIGQNSVLTSFQGAKSHLPPELETFFFVLSRQTLELFRFEMLLFII